MTHGRNHARWARPRHGLTLIEIMVATVVGGIALLMTHRLVAQIGEAGEHIARVSDTFDVRANGVRLLQALVAHAEARAESGGAQSSSARIGVIGLEGTETQMRFATWCDAAAGWLEPCVALLQIEPVSAESPELHGTPAGTTHAWHLRAQLTTGEDIVAMRSAEPMALRYLVSAVDGGRWARSWAPDVTLPTAVAVIAGIDTTVLRVGSGLP